MKSRAHFTVSGAVKRAFPTFEAARVASESYARFYHQRMSVYQCGECSGFHIGHRGRGRRRGRGGRE